MTEMEAQSEKVVNSLVEDAVTTFRSRVTDSYELETEFIDAICDIVVDCCTTLHDTMATAVAEAQAAASEATSARASKPARAKTEGKKTRKKSAYNMFVRSQMQTQEIQDLPHKAKMGSIAEKWKAICNDEKEVKPYKDLADEINAQNEQSA